MLQCYNVSLSLVSVLNR